MTFLGQFGVTIDSTIYKSTTGLFQFRANPQIFSFSPKAVIPSSNLSVTFEGISLNAAANPRILFMSGRQPGYYVGIWNVILTVDSLVGTRIRRYRFNTTPVNTNILRRSPGVPTNRV